MNLSQILAALPQLSAADLAILEKAAREQAGRLSQEAANAWPVGTVLMHTEFGKVRYWRACPELGGDIHVVTLTDRKMIEERDGEDMVTVGGQNL